MFDLSFVSIELPYVVYTLLTILALYTPSSPLWYQVTFLLGLICLRLVLQRPEKPGPEPLIHRHQASTLQVAFALMLNFFYNGFVGTVSCPATRQLVSSRLRILTIGLSTGCNYFFNWLISYCSPVFINANDLNWEPKYGYIWAGANAIAFGMDPFLSLFFCFFFLLSPFEHDWVGDWSSFIAVFFFFFMPEMKGRSLEELDEMFQNSVGSRLSEVGLCLV